jgi:hypothetical protein
MFNRNHRTLSAHLNRLNLGMRSLAFLAGVNTGDRTLRSRHAYPVVVRDGMPGGQPRAITGPRGEIAAIPCSPAGTSRPAIRRVLRPMFERVAEVPSHADKSCRRGGLQEPSSRPAGCKPAERHRKPFGSMRWPLGNGLAVRTWDRSSLGPRAGITAAWGG